MTQERFSRIVDDPDLLRTITYEELKTLALAYPYAHNLRYLLAIKARQMDHHDVVKNVTTAAVYSLDRTQLFRLVAPQMIAPQEVWVEEEVLELKPIETLKRKLEEELSSIEREENKVEAQLEASQPRAPEPELLASTILTTGHKPAFSAELKEIPIARIPYQTFAAWFSVFQPQALEPKAPATVETAPVGTLEPTSATANMAQEVPDFQAFGDDGDTENATPIPSKTAGIAQRLAEKSVAENKDVISETLAKLYAKQGYREKAITMYDRLSLAFPEKSTYFAAEIDKLKK